MGVLNRSVGRNFAAGMSGGVAYVWDADGRARARVNQEMVDVEPVADPADVEELRGLIEAHAEATGSQRARRILAAWDVERSRFFKVMPRDYRRALAELAAESAAAEMAAADEAATPAAATGRAGARASTEAAGAVVAA